MTILKLNRRTLFQLQWFCKHQKSKIDVDWCHYINVADILNFDHIDKFNSCSWGGIQLQFQAPVTLSDHFMSCCAGCARQSCCLCVNNLLRMATASCKLSANCNSMLPRKPIFRVMQWPNVDEPSNTHIPVTHPTSLVCLWCNLSNCHDATISFPFWIDVLK